MSSHPQLHGNWEKAYEQSEEDDEEYFAGISNWNHDCRIFIQRDSWTAKITSPEIFTEHNQWKGKKHARTVL